MKPDKIQEAIGYVSFGSGKLKGDDRVMFETVIEAAAGFAKSLDDPIWWCFEHGASVPVGNFEMCAHFEWQLAMGRTIAPCDIAEATRPRRIQ